MKGLLDTDTVIYYMKERPAVVGRLEATPTADHFLSLITLGELFFGIFRSAQVQRNLRGYRRFFTRVKLLPFTPAVAERFGVVKADLARRGEMVADYDLWIAVHALVHGATVVTNNERDFGRRIAGFAVRELDEVKIVGTPRRSRCYSLTAEHKRTSSATESFCQEWQPEFEGTRPH